eukprot:TRINITY_DN47808_c0_g1_i1.p1 TRINITY_DN47808_c0_g1~~TRINITY_DN47808_c0_g1_i1.p1  ORF type:complete len:197 (+),score=31.22 TRINITY_DN47808_c0_g1_i1:61-651(+)
MEPAVKLSALAIVPDADAWPSIQELRLAHDRQVHMWPPHINLLYPFVSEDRFESAAQALSAALTPMEGSLTLRFIEKSNFGKTAFLAPVCEQDPGLAELHRACVAAFPDFSLSRHGPDFHAHLTVGQFPSHAECREFVESSLDQIVQTEVCSLCLLARDSMKHPFRIVCRVRLGGEIVPGDGQPYAPDLSLRSELS